MSDALDRLEGMLLELCPVCEGRCQGCRHCWDVGYVEHRCGDPVPLTPDLAATLAQLHGLKPEGPA